MSLNEEAVRAALAAVQGGAAAAAPASPAQQPAALDAASVAAALQQVQQVQQRDRGEILALRASILADAGQMAQLSMQNPPFSEAARNDDPEVFIAFIREQDAKKRARDMEMIEFQRRVEANPFDTEAQAKIDALKCPKIALDNSDEDDSDGDALKGPLSQEEPQQGAEFNEEDVEGEDVEEEDVEEEDVSKEDADDLDPELGGVDADGLDPN